MSDAPILTLEGTDLQNGWTVGKLLKREAPGSGGYFSVGYLATHRDGREGYLKALDFRRALDSADPATELQNMFNGYVFERDVLSYCTGARFDKVVVAVGSGDIPLAGAPLDRLFYLIFELADGDTSCQSDRRYRRDGAWRLRCLQHISTALSQLHARGVYHQDLRPSNILVFDKTSTSKVADLGRSHCRDIAAPHDGNLLPGVVRYAPLEQLYAYQLADRMTARAAGDLYLFGSMMYFMFTGAMLTPVILGHLRAEHRPLSLHNPTGWRGDYAGVMPYLEDARSQALVLFKNEVTSECDGRHAAELLRLISSLTEVRPEQRGHPDQRKLVHGDRFSLQRYISALNRIAGQHALKVKLRNAAVAA